MQNETLISLDLLDEVRNTLAQVYTYHAGYDLIESQRKMWPETRNSNLTLEIQSTLKSVEDLVSAHVMRERDARRARRQSDPIPYTDVEPPGLDDEPEVEMCEPNEHAIDDDGYCVYCGYDEDQIEEAQGDGQTVEDTPESE